MTFHSLAFVFSSPAQLVSQSATRHDPMSPLDQFVYSLSPFSRVKALHSRAAAAAVFTPRPPSSPRDRVGGEAVVEKLAISARKGGWARARSMHMRHAALGGKALLDIGDEVRRSGSPNLYLLSLVYLKLLKIPTTWFSDPDTDPKKCCRCRFDRTCISIHQSLTSQ